MKNNKNIWDQLQEKWDSPEPYNSEKGINKETLKAAVDYIFKAEPREKAKNGEGQYIDVYQSEEMLSISLKGDGTKFMTGVRGFISMLDINDSWSLRTLPIKFNGVVLDDDQTEEFWQETERIKNKIEDEKTN